jgi:ketosteroid isomerase-like protein
MSDSTDIAHDLAEDWFAAWNAHDLDRILSHYAEDIVFSSPYVASLGADPSGTLVGKDRLRAYWRTALDRFPDLRFEPLGRAYGVASVVLHYRGVGGILASEVLELGPDGLVHRSCAHYAAGE